MLTYILLTLIIVLLSYIIYHIPIVIAGAIFNSNHIHAECSEYPMVSIIVPARNEERVIGRCLEALLNQDYPKSRYEVIVIDGNSRDGTSEICIQYVDRHPDLVKLIREEVPRGKPDALNRALRLASGEIITVFDADSVPPRDALSRVVAFLSTHPEYSAVQCRVSSINADRNILTRIIYVEEMGWFRLILRGRERLNLFIPLTGNGMFIRRDALEGVGGWKPGELTEDIELAIRLYKNGYKVKYMDEVTILQEAPSKLSAFIRQRFRWFRGYLEALRQYGKLVWDLRLKSLDAEVLLMGPILMAFSSITYLSLIAISFMQPDYLNVSWFLSLMNIFLALILLSVLLSLRPRNIYDALTILAIIPYWMFQSIIAMKAVIDFILRRPATWLRTEKEGVGINM